MTSEHASPMGPKAKTRRTVFVVGVILLLGGGCGPTAGGGGTNHPGGGGNPDTLRPQGAQEGNSAPELRKRIERLRGEQRNFAVAAQTDQKVCETVCTLATQICGATEKLCGVADGHPQDQAYQGLCREAQQECTAASEHCETCVGGLETQPEGPTEPPTDESLETVPPESAAR